MEEQTQPTKKELEAAERKAFLEEQKALAERIEAANKAQEELLNRQEAMNARNALGGESEAGVIVKVGVEVNGVEHISYLPLMDFKNKSISKDSFDMMDVNKAIQRATVKAIGLHGLGLYIYAGEDLPEDDNAEKEVKKTSTRSKKVQSIQKTSTHDSETTTELIYYWVTDRIKI